MSDRDTSRWAKWADFADEVGRWIPGVDTPNLVFALRDAAREFFEETWAWRYTVEENIPITFPPPTTAQPTPNGNFLYPVPIPDFTLLAGVGYLAYFDPGATLPRPIWPIDENLLNTMGRVVPATSAALGWWDQSGAVQNYLIWNDHQSLRLFPQPAPNQVGAYLTEMLTFLTPNRRSPGIPQYLADRFYQELGKLGAAILYETPGKSWTDQAQAQVFRDAMVSQKVKVVNSLRRGRTKAQPMGTAPYPVA